MCGGGGRHLNFTNFLTNTPSQAPTQGRVPADSWDRMPEQANKQVLPILSSQPTHRRAGERSQALPQCRVQSPEVPRGVSLTVEVVSVSCLAALG